MDDIFVTANISVLKISLNKAYAIRINEIQKDDLKLKISVLKEIQMNIKLL